MTPNPDDMIPVKELKEARRLLAQAARIIRDGELFQHSFYTQVAKWVGWCDDFLDEDPSDSELQKQLDEAHEGVKKTLNDLRKCFTPIDKPETD